MLSQATRRTKASEPLTCEIILNHDFTLADNAKLTIEFIKFLCVQKGQIPVPCSQLEKLASLAKVEIEKTPNNFKVDCKSYVVNVPTKKLLKSFFFGKFILDV